jgi:hypothetical protein
MRKTKRKHAARVNRAAFYAIVVCAALITVGLVLLFFSMYAVYKVYEVPMVVKVSDRSSFNTDSDMINFGKAVPGNTNTRSMVLAHDHSKPLLISFKKEGNISGFVALPDDFYLEPGLSKEVNINAAIPMDAPQGDYTGTLTVYFRKI